MAVPKKRKSHTLTANRIIKKSLGYLAKSLGVLNWRAKLGRKPIFIINYHRILPAHEINHYLFKPMVLSLTVFEKQIDFFRRRCNVLSLDECVSILKKNLTIPERAVVLTFDDGYNELYSIAKPILEKYELPATIFLPVG